MELHDKLKLLILDCPYGQFENVKVKRLFSEIVALKIRGYVDKYKFGVLPVDTTDYIGTHIVVSDGDRPIMAFKSITRERCDFFGVPFPIMALMAGRATQACVNATQDIVSKAYGGISYDSSWTLAEEGLSESVKLSILEMMMALITFYHADPSFRAKDCLLAGVPKVKTDKYFIKMGASPVCDEPEFRIPTLDGEKVALLHFKEPSAQAKRACMKYRLIWERKEVLRAKELEVALPAAA